MLTVYFVDFVSIHRASVKKGQLYYVNQETVSCNLNSFAGTNAAHQTVRVTLLITHPCNLQQTQQIGKVLLKAVAKHDKKTT